jgi:hypothetical protein
MAINFNDYKAGGWAFGEELSSGTMNDQRDELLAAFVEVDQQLVNGEDGGVYTPSALLELNNTVVTIPNDDSINCLTSASAELAMLGITDTDRIFLGNNVTPIDVYGDTSIFGTLDLFGSINVGTNHYLDFDNQEVTNYAASMIPYSAAGGWGTDSIGTANQTNVSGVGSVWYRFRMPPATNLIKRVIANIAPAVTGRANVPDDRPSVRLRRWRLNSNGTRTQTTYLQAFDAVATMPAYESAHQVISNPISADCQPNDMWGVEVTGEAGANAVIGLVVNGILIDYEFSRIRG